MNEMGSVLRRARFLMNRLPMARVRVDRARGDGFVDTAKGAYGALREELEALRDVIRPAIETLEDPLDREVMEMRYLQGLSVREIAYRINYSEQHVFRVAQRAAGKLESRES